MVLRSGSHNVSKFFESVNTRQNAISSFLFFFAKKLTKKLREILVIIFNKEGENKE